jgi:hypothetical protein
MLSAKHRANSSSDAANTLQPDGASRFILDQAMHNSSVPYLGRR